MKKRSNNKANVCDYSYRNDIEIIKAEDDKPDYTRERNYYIHNVDESVNKVMQIHRELQEIQKKHLMDQEIDSKIKTVEELRSQYKNLLENNI